MHSGLDSACGLEDESASVHDTFKMLSKAHANSTGSSCFDGEVLRLGGIRALADGLEDEKDDEVPKSNGKDDDASSTKKIKKKAMTLASTVKKATKWMYGSRRNSSDTQHFGIE